MSILETVQIIIAIEKSTQPVNFLIADRLESAVILRWDIFYINVEAFKPRLTIVEMDDGFTVPIIREPSTLDTNVPMTDEQCFNVRKKRAAPKGKNIKARPIETSNPNMGRSDNKSAM